MYLLKLLFLLAFLRPSLGFSQSCRKLLQTQNYSGFELAELEIRPPETILNTRSTSFTILELENEGKILSNGRLPYTRTQCYGTCYLYASLGLVENELIINGALEDGDLALAPSLLIETAQARIHAGTKTQSVEAILESGSIDAYHSLHGHFLYVLPRSEIGSLGPVSESTEVLLTLEEKFLSEYLGAFDQNFNIDTYSITDPRMSSYMTELAAQYFQEHSSSSDEITLRHTSIGPLAFNYTYSMIYNTNVGTKDQPVMRPFRLTKTIDTGTIQTAAEQRMHLATLNKENGDSIQELDSLMFEDEDIYKIVEKLLESKYVFVGLESDLFDEGHAVLFTNLVVDPETQTILGFIFLDSNASDQGYQGFRFINVEEVRRYMIHYNFINEVRFN